MLQSKLSGCWISEGLKRTVPEDKIIYFFVNRFTGTTISKGSKDAKVYIAGTMTKWRAIEMSRQVRRAVSDRPKIIEC